MSTIPLASASMALAMQVTGRTHYLTAVCPHIGVELGASTLLESLLVQPSSGSVVYSLYSRTGDTLTLVGYTDSVSSPSAGMVSSPLSSLAGAYAMGVTGAYYAGILTDMNSPVFAGVAASSPFNTTPYIAMRFDNQAATPAATLIMSNETASRFYMGIRA